MATLKPKRHLRAETDMETRPSPQPSNARIPNAHLDLGRRKHEPTATEKYYLQIISTMKGEMESLYHIIQSKEQDVEKLRGEKMELKAANRHLRTLLAGREVQGGDFPNPLSRSMQIPSMKSYLKK